MSNTTIQQTAIVTKTVNIRQAAVSRLSDNAFYLMELGCQLKRLLGPASLPHFLATGETIVFNNKAVG